MLPPTGYCVLDLLRAVAQVHEHAHHVLHALVIDVGALDGAPHQVEQTVHEAVRLPQLLPRVVPGRAHDPQHPARVPVDLSQPLCGKITMFTNTNRASSIIVRLRSSQVPQDPRH